MKEGYYITSDDIRHPIKPINSLYLSNMDLIKLVVPDSVKYIYCSNNKLTELILPDGVEKVDCHNNKLSELILPNSIEYVWCDNINIQDLDRFINDKYVRIDIDIGL